ncbi:glycosyltransferase family protein [Spirosoma utsteinense]|uniref:glycosyltransferase family 2 protein n=1 Tax=Spirosoma utsteinense TaxID=2585773 RepID=UPI001647F43D|nr:glycosyltransferase family 2 protein [Spirosoma utsteinense]MBC3786451.1 glycosyltransferase involved in cell wall biosynthesis [Spirosoma utsteinense]
MKVAGFSFIRNAVQFDYPIVEAITSVLPLCDEFVVAVGDSDDDTLALIKAIPSDKIRIIHTTWDQTARAGGRVLAQETDKALAAISPDADWAFYIQGDEVLHEQSIPAVRQAMETYLADPTVDGLLFKYLHFYGSYSYVGNSRRWYRREIRIIRNSGNVVSYKDAQGFRSRDNQKLRVKLIDAHIYHYGWVRPPKTQHTRLQSMHRFYHDDGTEVVTEPEKAPDFDYNQADSLLPFTSAHPAVMQARVDRLNWSFNFDTRQKNYKTPRLRLLAFVEKLTGWRIGEYKNYKLV